MYLSLGRFCCVEAAVRLLESAFCPSRREARFFSLSFFIGKWTVRLLRLHLSLALTIARPSLRLKRVVRLLELRTRALNFLPSSRLPPTFQNAFN